MTTSIYALESAATAASQVVRLDDLLGSVWIPFALLLTTGIWLLLAFMLFYLMWRKVHERRSILKQWLADYARGTQDLYAQMSAQQKRHVYQMLTPQERREILRQLDPIARSEFRALGTTRRGEPLQRASISNRLSNSTTAPHRSSIPPPTSICPVTSISPIPGLARSLPWYATGHTGSGGSQTTPRRSIPPSAASGTIGWEPTTSACPASPSTSPTPHSTSQW